MEKKPQAFAYKAPSKKKEDEKNKKLGKKERKITRVKKEKDIICFYHYY